MPITNNNITICETVLLILSSFQPTLEHGLYVPTGFDMSTVLNRSESSEENVQYPYNGILNSKIIEKYICSI